MSICAVRGAVSGLAGDGRLRAPPPSSVFGIRNARLHVDGVREARSFLACLLCTLLLLLRGWCGPSVGYRIQRQRACVEIKDWRKDIVPV